MTIPQSPDNLAAVRKRGVSPRTRVDAENRVTCRGPACRPSHVERVTPCFLAETGQHTIAKILSGRYALAMERLNLKARRGWSLRASQMTAERTGGGARRSKACDRAARRKSSDGSSVRRALPNASQGGCTRPATQSLTLRWASVEGARVLHVEGCRMSLFRSDRAARGRIGVQFKKCCLDQEQTSY
jgi:hypothetical protein